MVLFQRRVYENVEPAFVYDVSKMHYYYVVLTELRFLSFWFPKPKEDSRCPTFLVVEGSRDLFHNVPLATIPYRWVGLEIRTVPVVARQSQSPSQRVYSSSFTSLVFSKQAVWCTNRKVEGEPAPAICQHAASLSKQHDSSPTTRKCRIALRHPTLYNKWMNRNLLFANCLPLIY